jgi:DNA-binding CsgD family transcriptional regulator/tetratricopeptide (TPR) repeat protein
MPLRLATREPWSKVAIKPSGDREIELLEREEQLQRLEKAFALARDGRGRIVAIAGEAGAGKTALVERFVAAHGTLARVHRGACENLSTPEALLPLRDIARASGAAFDAGADHIQSFEALLKILTGSALPTVLVIEDLHWADTVTLDLIRFLARRIGSVRALVLLTYRDEELDARSPMRTLLGEAPPGRVERMTLESLSINAVSHLAQRAGRRGDELFALTAGNPFLVTETLAVESDVPTDAVRDATLARASRLPPQAWAVLEAVSIFPRRAETAIVADLSKGAFGIGLDACVERGMLSLEGATLRFRHELARRAIEAFIAPSRRRALHQAVVDELIRRPTARASEIAHHAERAADVTALLKFARRAGDEAARAGAPREAASHYRAILMHRQALDAAAIVDLLERFAEQSYLMGGADVAMSSMLEAADLRRASGDILNLGRDLTRLTRFAWMCGRRLDAERFVQEAITVLERAAAGVELAWAYSHKSQLEMLASQMEAAVHWGNRALALAERLGDVEIVIHALGNIGSAKADSVRSGSCTELERSFELALAGSFHDHVERASCNLTCTHYIRRDFPSSLGYIERGVAYAAARELTHWEGYLRGWRAMIHLDQGDWTGAEDEIERVLSRAYASGVYRFPALVALARLRLRRGDPDAETPLEEVRSLSASLAELQRSVYLAVVLAEKAWLCNAEGMNAESSEAIALLREVCALAVARGAYWAADDAALWLHMLGESPEDPTRLSAPFRDHCEGRWRAAAGGWAALGKPYEEALALSDGDEEAQRRALEIFDRLAAAPAAARLRRRMRAKGSRAIPRGPTADTRANPAGLTRRQAQVLNLVDEGLSNVEIADRLCISAKTAEHHVSAIIARLGVASRRDAAVAARTLGMAPGGKK